MIYSRYKDGLKLHTTLELIAFETTVADWQSECNKIKCNMSLKMLKAQTDNDFSTIAQSRQHKGQKLVDVECLRSQRRNCGSVSYFFFHGAVLQSVVDV